MREEAPDELPPKEVSSFFLTGAGKRAYFSVEEGGHTHVFQLSTHQLMQLGQICLHVAQRLEQGKTAP
jgi:hypothetical protein